MLYRQRTGADPESFEPVDSWEVSAERTDGSTFDPEPCAQDWYVVIDDLADGRVVFDAARWPRLDLAGRLSFDERRETRAADLEPAQHTIDAARRALEQQARPLRIGDAFLVRGPALPEHVLDWRLAADVTRPARDAAKLALFAAVAPSLRPEEEALLPRAEPAEPAPGETATGDAFPSV